MHKRSYLLLFFVLVLCGGANAQHLKGQQLIPSTTHDYYIFISGVNARADVEKIENSINKKSGVTYFLGDRYPVRYFLLKSTDPVTLSQFNAWIDQQHYKVEYFGEGIYAKERAMVTGKKFKQIQ